MEDETPCIKPQHNSECRDYWEGNRDSDDGGLLRFSGADGVGHGRHGCAAVMELLLFT
jgi:hypothetical protein